MPLQRLRFSNSAYMVSGSVNLSQQFVEALNDEAFLADTRESSLAFQARARGTGDSGCRRVQLPSHGWPSSAASSAFPRLSCCRCSSRRSCWALSLVDAI